MTSEFQVSTSIERPADVVWSIMTDFARAPEWMPGVEAVAAKDDRPLSSGKVFTTELSTGGRGRVRDMTLSQWEPEHHVFALASTEGSVRAEYRYTLTADGPRTQVDLLARCDGGGLIMRLLSPLIVRMMARHDSRQMPLLKELIETVEEPADSRRNPD